MLAGEGLGGVAQALLAIIGVDGSSKHPYLLMLQFPRTDRSRFCLLSEYGTVVGCPDMEYCG